MKKLLSERNLIIFLFFSAIGIFSFAQEKCRGVDADFDSAAVHPVSSPSIASEAPIEPETIHVSTRPGSY